MKQILLLVATLLLINCGTFHQIYETKSTNAKLINDIYIYETDSVKLKYIFWEERGIVAFSIYNNLDKPIYIDWNKSSIIFNSEKFNYWIDAETVKTNTSYNSYVLKEDFNLNQSTVKTLAVSNSIRVKKERITFIPPKSYSLKYTYKITNNQAEEIDRTAITKINKFSISKKKRTLDEIEYDYNNSPLKFRNFLSFSLTENFEKEFYIDNEFYVSKIIELDSKDFEYIKKDENNNEMANSKGEYIYITPYKKMTSFYKVIPKGYSLKAYKKRTNQPFLYPQP